MAIKKLRTQQMTKKQIDEFAREAAVMVGLRHPSIQVHEFYYNYWSIFDYLKIYGCVLVACQLVHCHRSMSKRKPQRNFEGS